MLQASNAHSERTGGTWDTTSFGNPEVKSSTTLLLPGDACAGSASACSCLSRPAPPVPSSRSPGRLMAGALTSILTIGERRSSIEGTTLEVMLRSALRIDDIDQLRLS